MAPVPDPPQMTITQPSGDHLSVNAAIMASPSDLQSHEGLSPLSPSAVSETQMDSEEKKMQVMWDGAIHRNMNLPDGHDRVGVLIIKWEDDLDELKCRDEVDRLQETLKGSFQFETQVLELENSKNPQHQLFYGIAAFVKEYDHPQNLLIVYYSGHGAFIDDKFELHATTQWKRRPKIYEPRACWNIAEFPLLAAEGEVLVIFDSCHASNLMQKGGSNDLKTYELFAACGIDGQAVIPGKDSFTEALIHALKILSEEFKDSSFTTWHLWQNISCQRPKHPPFLWNRRRRDDNHIRLAPVKPSAPKRSESWKHYDPNARYLNLTFHVATEILDCDQIENLTKHLPAAFAKSKVACHRIDFNGLKGRQEHFRNVVREVILRNNVRKLSHSSQRSAVTNAESPEAQAGGVSSGETPAPVTSNEEIAVLEAGIKRSASSNDDGQLAPAPKRRDQIYHSRSRARGD